MGPRHYRSQTNKYVRWGFKAVTPTVVVGDPRLSSKEQGERIMGLLTELCLEVVERELRL